MADPETPELARDLGSLGGRRLGEAPAQRGRRRVDPDFPTALGIDEREFADIGQVAFAGIVDLDGDDLVARGECARGRSQSRGPRRSDTTTTRPPRGAVAATNWSAAAGEATPRTDGAASSVASAAPRASSKVASKPSRPTRGGTRRSAPSPNVTIPSRLPRWVARCPTASATPSATSAFRRSAVPNVIDGERSRMSQVVSARSGTWTRTCGTVVRAVTFQSMRRTSSPG